MPFAPHDSLQPIVLVGGQSHRFGRDKLREPLMEGGSEWLVDRPIRALRDVFGPGVALVGACHADVARRGDFVIEDRHPGVGPAGGILSALESQPSDVFVLAGDLPDITADAVRIILEAAMLAGTDAVEPWVVLANAAGVQPCIGVYRQAIRSRLAERIAKHEHHLHDLAPPDRLLLVPIADREARNVNHVSDWTDTTT